MLDAGSTPAGAASRKGRAVIGLCNSEHNTRVSTAHTQHTLSDCERSDCQIRFWAEQASAEKTSSMVRSRSFNTTHAFRCLSYER